MQIFQITYKIANVYSAAIVEGHGLTDVLEKANKKGWSVIDWNEITI